MTLRLVAVSCGLASSSWAWLELVRGLCRRGPSLNGRGLSGRGPLEVGSCADFVDLDIDPTLLIDRRELRMAAAGQKEFLDRVLMLACACLTFGSASGRHHA